MPDSYNLEIDSFLLSHSLRGFSPWLVGSNTDTACRNAWERKAAQSVAARQRVKRAARDKNIAFQSHPRKPALLVRPYLQTAYSAMNSSRDESIMSTVPHNAGTFKTSFL